MPLEHQNFAPFQMPFAGATAHHPHYHQLVSHPHIHSSVIHENNSNKSDAGAHLASSATVSHQETASGHEKNPSPGMKLFTLTTNTTTGHHSMVD